MKNFIIFWITITLAYFGHLILKLRNNNDTLRSKIVMLESTLQDRIEENEKMLNDIRKETIKIHSMSVEELENEIQIWKIRKNMVEDAIKGGYIDDFGLNPSDIHIINHKIKILEQLKKEKLNEKSTLEK